MKTWLSKRLAALASSIAENTLVLSLRESYIALIPFFILSAVISLLVQWFKLDSLPYAGEAFRSFGSIIWVLLPLVTLLSFSFYLAKNLRINTIAAPVLAPVCFVMTTDYLSLANTVTLNHRSGVFYTILMPIICCYSLRFFSQFKQLKLVGVSSVSLFLRKHLNLIFPYLFVALAVFLLVPLLNSLVLEVVSQLAIWEKNWSSYEKVSIHLVVSHLLWLVGIHVDNAFHILFPDNIVEYQVVDAISNHSFFSVFVILGGTGAIWGLVIACLLQPKNSNERKIAKLSLPLTSFNISEIMIYALPVVLNPYFVVPFILAPTVNTLISISLIDAGVISVTANTVPWFTPVGISAWLATESWLGVALQLALIVLSTCIYYPFVVASRRSQVQGKALDMLSKRLSIGQKLEDGIEKSYVAKQSNQLRKDAKLRHVMESLNRGRLRLFYQPKVNIHTHQIVGFEALLRLQTDSGKIEGPWFLSTLAEHNLMDSVDAFVIDQLEADLETLNSVGLIPNISFNLSPNSLLNVATRKRVIKAFSRFPHQAEVELLETDYISDLDKTSQWVNALREANINTAIDDFGSGYSCLALLTQLNVDTIKFDRGLLPKSNDKRQQMVYQALAKTCLNLGYKVVAEGIELTQQQEWLKSLDINVAQGYLFYRPMPLEEAQALLLRQQQALAEVG